MEVSFSLEAFSKIILHLTKYPQMAVSGILLRKVEKGSKTSAKASSVPNGTSNEGSEGKEAEAAPVAIKSSKYVFDDVIPCLHMNKYVTPMMELALAQIDRFCKVEHYEIVGYYQANQSLQDNHPDFVALRIAEKLAEVNPKVLVVMVNNEQLNSNLECAPFTFYQLGDGKLRLQDTKVLLQPDHQGALSTASALIQAKAYRDLYDFDNHLENIGLNYCSNPDVNERIQQLAS